METETMGRVTVEVQVENLSDLYLIQRGQLAPEHARKVIIIDALVDTGATSLSLPIQTIQQLGLQCRHSKRIRSSIGVAEVGLYDAVRLTIQGRDCTVDVLEVPDGVPASIGQVPLELLDFVVNPQSRTLTGNPAHGGEHMFEMY